MLRTLLMAALVSSFLVDLPAQACEGGLEINQACAPGGCFPGDDPLFPVTLTRPGRYCLTGNLESRQPIAIVIATGLATLDLGGFVVTCSGAPLAGSTCVGVDDDGPGTSREGNVVRDGTVEFAGDVGVLLADRSRVERMRVRFSLGNGIEVGEGSAVLDSEVHRNFAIGISAAEGSLIRGNVVSLNSSIGIITGPGATVSGNASSNNGGTGISSRGSVVSNNSSFSNSGVGILMTEGLVRANAVHDNDEEGVVALDANVHENALTGNGEAGLRCTGVLASTNFRNNVIENNGDTVTFSPTTFCRDTGENSCNAATDCL